MEITVDEREGVALLLLLKLGMDTYTCEEPSAEAVEGLAHIPNIVIDRMIAKVSLAGGKAARGSA